jgi:hypothetical protein
MNIKIHFKCEVHIYMDAQILGTWSLWQQKYILNVPALVPAVGGEISQSVREFKAFQTTSQKS